MLSYSRDKGASGCMRRLVSPKISSRFRPSTDGSKLAICTGRRSSLLRKSEGERRPLTQFRLDPDPSLMPRHDFAADRETHAAARRPVARLQHAEDAEDLLCVLRLDADAVVLHRDQPLA